VAPVGAPLADGLLAGTCRTWLLELGMLRERSLALRDLEGVEAFYLVNAVRGLREVARIVDGGGRTVYRRPSGTADRSLDRGCREITTIQGN